MRELIPFVFFPIQITLIGVIQKFLKAFRCYHSVEFAVIHALLLNWNFGSKHLEGYPLFEQAPAYRSVDLFFQLRVD